MKAVVVGATGATGTDLTRLLLEDDSFTKVAIFVRRNTGTDHPKLKSHIIDFDRPGDWKHLVNGDILFSCLGTTLKVAGSKAAQWRIDHDYQLQFAKAAKENGMTTYVLVSSGNASPNSLFFYTKMKGALETAVKQLFFTRLIIFKPPLLLRKNSNRKGELMAANMLKFLNKAGLFNSQKPLPTEELALAMIEAGTMFGEGIYDIHPPQIRHLASAYSDRKK